MIINVNRRESKDAGTAFGEYHLGRIKKVSGPGGCSDESLIREEAPWSRPQARNTPGALVHEPAKAKPITLDSRQEI